MPESYIYYTCFLIATLLCASAPFLWQATCIFSGEGQHVIIIQNHANYSHTKIYVFFLSSRVLRLVFFLSVEVSQKLHYSICAEKDFLKKVILNFDWM